MSGRFVRILCAAVLVLVLAGGAYKLKPVSAPAAPLARQTGIYPERQRPAPLVSAMFLVLAGFGISMLFDKNDKDN